MRRQSERRSPLGGLGARGAVGRADIIMPLIWSDDIIAHLLCPVPDPARMERRDDLHELPTPRTTADAGYLRVLLTCWACQHQTDADLGALIAAGRGDVPLIEQRWRCGQCGHRK